MPRLELTFLHSANGGGCNARGGGEDKSVNCSAVRKWDHTRARGPYVVDPFLSGAYLLPIMPTDPENPNRVCNPRITPATS
jgi:hypothetical protein